MPNEMTQEIQINENISIKIKHKSETTLEEATANAILLNKIVKAVNTINSNVDDIKEEANETFDNKESNNENVPMLSKLPKNIKSTQVLDLEQKKILVHLWEKSSRNKFVKSAISKHIGLSVEQLCKTVSYIKRTYL
jgi:hypothetical protein